MKRVLLVLSQMPQDPASGAARSMRTICEMLASFPERFVVRGVGTTATERLTGSGECDAENVLAASGITPAVEPAAGSRPRVLRFERCGVGHALMDTGARLVHQWAAETDRAFTELVVSEARTFRPDIVFTYGGQPGEVERRRRLREGGAAVVFGLRNHSYLTPSAFVHTDALLTPSRFLSGVYERRLGVRSTALPVPINEDEVVSAAREPVFHTFVNPSLVKGVMLFARVAEMLGSRRADIPLMVVESRGDAGALVRAGLAGGFDLRRHRSILVSPGVNEPKHIYAASRTVLVPSVWEEPSGRVAGEALINGIPAVVSDRGGLPETVGGGGFVVPLPWSLTVQAMQPVGEREAGPWVELIERLNDDAGFYLSACERARREGEGLRFSALAPRYAEFFEGVRRGDGVRAGG